MAGDIPFARTLPGLVVTDPVRGLAVNVQGGMPPVKWPAGYVPTAGDAVDVLILDGIARVLGPAVTGPRAARGTVADAPSGGTVLLDTVFGQVRAQYVGTAPSIGASVFLDWQATTPRLLSSESAAAVTPPSGPAPRPPDPAPAQSSGTLTITALDSGTWNVNYSAWSSFHGTNVVQGTWAGQTYRGAWFYGSAAAQLKGATITAARLRLGYRRRLGNYNSAASIDVWRHTAASRPGGDVSRVTGPHTVAVAVNAPAQWVAIPASFGQALVNSGGGLSLAGGTYVGITGVGEDPASGQIQLDWQR